MEEGTVVRWLKGVGDRVDEGEVLAEIETEKVTTELVAPQAGQLVEILVGEGKIAPVGALLAVISDE